MQNATPFNSNNTNVEQQAYGYFQSKYNKIIIDNETKNLEEYLKDLRGLASQILKLPIHEAESLLILEMSITNRQN